MRIYISGPMSGLPDLNFPAFNEAATCRLRGLIKESTLVKRGANRIELELLTRSKS